jgi:hypothetical protein
MFALPFKQWVAVATNGTMARGVFAFDMSFSLRADIRWAAVFDEDSNQGAVYQYPGGHAPVGSADGFKNSFWNRKCVGEASEFGRGLSLRVAGEFPHRYDHKLYLRIDPPCTLGEAVTIAHTVRGFEAMNDTWVETARSLVRGR